MKSIPVFYRPEQNADTRSASPSAAKPQLAVEDWLARPELGIEIHSFEPASIDELKRGHDALFIDGVLAGTRSNGFNNRDASVAKSLPYTNGSLLAACQHALAHSAWTISPTSGFHHAGWSKAQGFCTFNGLMVAALALKAKRLIDRIAILDCDAHYGNGTDEIIDRTGSRGWISHWTQGKHFQVASDAAGGKYNAWLKKALDECQRADLVIFQAGADPHIDDPYGGILTTEEMRQRDQLVFERLQGVPMAWNLAGGYQIIDGGKNQTSAERIEPVLALHRQTLREHRRAIGA